MIDTHIFWRLAGEVLLERERQDSMYGRPLYKNGTGSELDALLLARARSEIKTLPVTWKLVLNEEVREAFAEKDPKKIRAELVQVAAVALAWIESLDAGRIV